MGGPPKTISVGQQKFFFSAGFAFFFFGARGPAEFTLFQVFPTTQNWKKSKFRQKSRILAWIKKKIYFRLTFWPKVWVSETSQKICFCHLVPNGFFFLEPWSIGVLIFWAAALVSPDFVFPDLVSLDLVSLDLIWSGWFSFLYLVGYIWFNIFGSLHLKHFA